MGGINNTEQEHKGDLHYPNSQLLSHSFSFASIIPMDREVAISSDWVTI